MANDIAIKVEHVSKTFKLPREKQSSIKGILINKLKGGRASYEQQRALQDISFEVEKGEFFGIVGRNGSGKSTLLKMLAGIYNPTSGGIQVNGKLTPFIELGVGFNPELTGRENVFLNGALLGFNRTDMDAMYNDIVSFAELEKFMDQKLKNYSSGMQVRLAFSIAIRAQSDILLLDEVLAVGDAAFQKKCYDYFLQLKKDKRTVVLVTHDMSAIENFCDKALVIHNSESRGVMTPTEAASIYGRINAPNAENTSKNDTNKRWGSEKVTIKDITINGNKTDGSVSPIQSGKSLTLDFSFTSNEKRDIVIGLAFTDQFGVNVSGPNSLEHHLNSTQSVKYHVPKLPFAGGLYSMRVVIFDENANQEYDHWEDAARIQVQTTSTVHGKIDLFGEWKQQDHE